MIACFLEKLDVAEKAVAESDVFRIHTTAMFSLGTVVAPYGCSVACMGATGDGEREMRNA